MNIVGVKAGWLLVLDEPGPGPCVGPGPALRLVLAPVGPGQGVGLEGAAPRLHMSGLKVGRVAPLKSAGVEHRVDVEGGVLGPRLVVQQSRGDVIVSSGMSGVRVITGPLEVIITRI